MARMNATERALFSVCVVIFAITALMLLEKLNQSFMVTVPAHGGSLTEGVSGTPRFVNPILATTEADKDLSSLIYSGLLKKNVDGDLVPDLAQSYTISPDGLTYTFVINPKAVFQDGSHVTAQDVAFTIAEAVDPTIKSPRSGAWNGVTVAVIDDHTVTFTLKQAYGLFLQNTTLGILPKHAWSTVLPTDFALSQLNTKPIGSGPYKVASVSRNSSGVSTQYSLSSFNHYISGEPFISHITFKFYQSETDLLDAFKNGAIQSAYGLSAEDSNGLATKKRIESTILPRIFGIFFNKNENAIFADKAVRTALDTAINKDRIVQNILKGYGTTLSGPLPEATSVGASTQSDSDRIAAASSILSKDGWVKASSTGLWTKANAKNPKNPTVLSFTLSTGDTGELKDAAQSAVDDWTALGAQVDLHVYETSDLNQNIIRPRTYDALLFGEIIGWNGDLYPFWDSSERSDPGLNIAGYSNPKADALLESARTTSDERVRQTAYEQFATIVSADKGAIFLYSPDFLYAVPKNLQGLDLGEITEPSDRFGNIAREYVETETIWKLFNKN